MSLRRHRALFASSILRTLQARRGNVVDSTPLAVELVGIWKRFPGVIANREKEEREEADRYKRLSEAVSPMEIE